MVTGTSRLDDAVLGRILLLQSGVHAAPDAERLAGLLAHGLLRALPGVIGCRVSMADGQWLAGAGDADGDVTKRYALRTASEVHGEIELICDDLEAFVPYEPYVGNTVNLVALHLQSQGRANRLETLNRSLETQVAERTADLAASRVRLEQLINSTEARIFSVDREYRLIVGNEHFLDASSPATGRLEPGDFVMVSAVDSEVLAQWRGYFDRAFAGESFRLESWRSYSPKPSLAAYEISPLRDASGAIIGATVFGRDVTAVHETEVQLERQHALLEAIVDTAPVLVYVFDLEKQANVYTSSGVYRLLGYRPADLQAMESGVFARLVHPEDLPAVLASQERLAQGQDDETIHELSYRIRHVDGTWRTHHSYERIFVRDQHGKVTQKIGVEIDVTDQVAHEAALRRSESRFRQVYEQMAIGVARVGLDMRIESANRAYCEMLGYSEAELVGKHLADITVPESLAENLRLQRQLGRGEIDHYRLHKQFRHKDGHIVDGILDANLLRDGRGQPSHFLGTVADVSELESATRELQDRNQALERFNRLATGRELRMIALKQEVNALLGEIGRAQRYPLEFVED